MSEGQWKRWDAVARVVAGKLTTGEAATLLDLSIRQVRRIRRAVERRGRAGLGHGNRGQVPGNKLGAGMRTRILRLRRTTYRDFNDQHFTEKLAAETPPVRVSVRTVRRVLRAAQIPAVRQRRAPKHRRRRERKAQAGLMLLWDGSRHDWLEGRGPWLCWWGRSMMPPATSCPAPTSWSTNVRRAISACSARSSPPTGRRGASTWTSTGP